jgi:hypothetical protein
MGLFRIPQRLILPVEQMVQGIGSLENAGSLLKKPSGGNTAIFTLE